MISTTATLLLPKTGKICDARKPDASLGGSWVGLIGGL